MPAEEAFDPQELWDAAPGRGLPGRPPTLVPAGLRRQPAVDPVIDGSRALPGSAAVRLRLEGLVAEWLMELRVMSRSQRTIDWYRQKMSWYREKEGGPQTLDGLNAFEFKRLLASLQGPHLWGLEPAADRLEKNHDIGIGRDQQSSKRFHLRGANC